MTQYTQEEIEDMIEDLRAILDIRAKWNYTYQSISADYDMEDKVVVIRWYDHVNPEMRVHDIDRKVYVPVETLFDEISHQREELFEDLSDEDVQVLTELLLDYGNESDE